MKPQILLAIILYLLLYLIRYQQGGWDIQTEVLKDERQSLDKKISQMLPSPQAQLLSGILLGNKKDLPGQFKLALRDTSTLHIVVVSGQNLSLAAGLFLNLAGLIRRRTAIILSFLMIIFYTILTGAQVPVLRASFMVSFAFLAQILGREKDSPWILGLTASLMLLINPKWILDLSFQLSFLATFGVIVVAPVFLKYLKNLPFLGQDLGVTLGAQAMVTPVIASNFHQFSLVSVFANMLVLWTVAPIMILGSLMILVDLVWQGGAQILAFFTNAFLAYFIYIIQFFAHLPNAWVYVGEFNWLVWVGYYLVLAGFMLSLKYVKAEDFTGPEKGS